jgi:HlyD family secretion protein
VARPARVASLPLAFALVLSLAGGAARAQPAGRVDAVPVAVAPVVQRQVADEVTFIGSVEPSLATSAGAEVAGLVAEVAAQEGGRVVAGQTVLVRLDRRPRELELREAEAAVAKAREEFDKLRRGTREEEVAQRAAEMAAHRAVLARAEADYRRAERLHREELISLADLQRAESDYRAAEQQHEAAAQALRMARMGPRPEDIAQAQAELERAQARAARIADEIRRMTVRAPLTGFVVRKHVEVGTWVQPGTPLLDLIGLDPVFVTGPVGERQIPRVRLRQAAAVTVDAYPERRFAGTVTAVIPEADAGSRTFPVRVTVRNPDGALKAGMFARVTVRVGAPRTALFVPRDAVVRRGGQEFVFVVEEGAARLVRIETGTAVDTLVEVRGNGLAAGQPAVTLGNEFLQPGARVRVAP